jgi:hydrogenase maturation factor
MGVIASGALLITAPPHEAEKILQEADHRGKAIFQIGQVTSAGSQKPALTYSKGKGPLPFFERDEIAKIF